MVTYYWLSTFSVSKAQAHPSHGKFGPRGKLPIPNEIRRTFYGAHQGATKTLEVQPHATLVIGVADPTIGQCSVKR